MCIRKPLYLYTCIVNVQIQYLIKNNTDIENFNALFTAMLVDLNKASCLHNFGYVQ